MDDNDKTILEIQKEVNSWASQFKEPYFPPLSMMACLTEEVGEIARVINNMYGSKKKKDTEEEKHLEEELGDLLFSLVCMANAEGVSLTDAYENKMDKVSKRDSNRWNKKEENQKKNS